jgi:hypothetical protein
VELVPTEKLKRCIIHVQDVIRYDQQPGVLELIHPRLLVNLYEFVPWLVRPTNQIPHPVELYKLVVHLSGVVSKHLQAVVDLLEHHEFMIELRLSHIEEALPYMLQLHLQGLIDRLAPHPGQVLFLLLI